jgi:hypothetical protein
LLLFWFTTDPGAHFPQINKPFQKWRKLATELEVDHKGAFRRVSHRIFVYEGGESKVSYDGGIPQIDRIHNINN